MIRTLLAATGDAPPWKWTHQEWLGFGLRAAIALAIALLVSVIGRRYLRRAQRLANEAGDEAGSGKLRRHATIVGLTATTVSVIIWFLVGMSILTWLGVSVGPLIASAGIIGVALGFGAQTLVRDTISGTFILLEGQFDVGDSVDLDTEGGRVSGTIEALTLRITSVRQFDGTLSIVPNGTIQITSNKTRGWGRAIVDVRVAVGEDPERVRTVLEDLFTELVTQEPFVSGLRADPQILGVMQTTDAAQIIRVTAETKPNERFKLERLMRERINARIAEQGIRVPPVPMAPAMHPTDEEP